MWSTGKKFSERGGSCNLAAQRSAPFTTPLKATAAEDKPSYRTPCSHGTPNVRSSEASPYVRAKHVQMVDKDPQKSIALFWAAINSGDRVDSALKDMAFSMKQLDRAEEAIEAIKSFRNLCSPQSQESIDNVLLELYKKCGRIDEQIEMLQYKLKMIDEGLAFGGRTTKLTRYKGKRFHVSVEHEKSRILGNLAWAYVQLENYQEAEPLYRKALSIEEDYNKQCNLAICLMRTGKLEEGKIILQGVKRELIENCDEASLRSLERASEVLMELELHGNLNERKKCSPKQDAAFEDGKKELADNPRNISFLRREKRIDCAKHTLEKAPRTNDCKLSSNVLYGCDQSELHGGNSISSGNLMNKNKSQRSIDLDKGSQRCDDIGKDECGISSRRGHDYMAFDDSSIFLIGIKGRTPDSSKFRNQKEHGYQNSGEKCNILKPKSLNRIWESETVNTPEKCKGRLHARLDVNLNKESDAFLNNGKLIDISEEKTPTRSSKIHQYQISESDSVYSTRDIKADRMTSSLTGARIQADLVEEEELSTPNIMVASDDNLKTQLIKKGKRKTWADMVDEEEQFASQKLNIHVALDDENLVASEDGLRTQSVHKCERRTWIDTVGEEEELSTPNTMVASDDNLKTQLIKKGKRKTWADMVDEEEQFASQKLNIHVALEDENLVASEDGLRTQSVHKCERRTWIDTVGEDEPFTNVSCHHSKASVKTIESNRESSEECFQTPLVFGRTRRSGIDVAQAAGSSRNGLTVHSNPSVQRALFLDAEPISDPSIDCSVQQSMESIIPPNSGCMTAKEMGFSNNSGLLSSNSVMLQSRLQVFQEITCDDIGTV